MAPRARKRVKVTISASDPDSSKTVEEVTAIASTSTDSASHKTDPKSTSVFKNGIFTFIVGQEQERFEVHVSAFERISKPLGVMMTNGQMEESIKKEAILQDVEPSTFGLLIEFAYSGFCGIVKKLPSYGIHTVLPNPFRCHTCGLLVPQKLDDNKQYPFCNKVCREKHSVYSRHSTTCRYQVLPGVQCTAPANHKTHFYCVVDGSSIALDHTRIPIVHCSDCSNLDIAKDYPPYQRDPYNDTRVVTKCTENFELWEYHSSEMNSTELREHMRRHLPKVNGTQPPAQPLLLYAKLYLLATKYMVTDLPEICLHMFHVQLLTFHIDENSISEVVQLVLFVYENTHSNGALVDGTGDKLRELVMYYVEDRDMDVMQHTEFRDRLMAAADSAPIVDFLALKYK